MSSSAAGDHNGEAIETRIAIAVGQLANNPPFTGAPDRNCVITVRQASSEPSRVILDNRFYSALAGADRQQIGMRR